MNQQSLKKGDMSPKSAQYAISVLQEVDKIFGVLYEVPVAYFGAGASSGSGGSSTSSTSTPLDIQQIPPEIMLLIEKRAEFKNQKKYAEADAVRAEITALGYELKDRKTEFDLFKV